MGKLFIARHASVPPRSRGRPESVELGDRGRGTAVTIGRWIEELLDPGDRPVIESSSWRRAMQTAESIVDVLISSDRCAMDVEVVGNSSWTIDTADENRYFIANEMGRRAHRLGDTALIIVTHRPIFESVAPKIVPEIGSVSTTDVVYIQPDQVAAYAERIGEPAS